MARFKFHGQPSWAGHLAALILQDDGARRLVLEADVIAPIPLPERRLRERGYNQAWELARHLRRQVRPTAAPVPDLLLRSDSTQVQHALPRAERFEYARQAFAVNRTYQPVLAQASVLLVDDVMTTGATLQAAADLLLRAGAARVKALVFARTPAPGNVE